MTLFSQFLKMADQLQTSVISKRLELEQRDCAHMKDLSMQFQDLISFFKLSHRKVVLLGFKGAQRLLRQVVQSVFKLLEHFLSYLHFSWADFKKIYIKQHLRKKCETMVKSARSHVFVQQLSVFEERRVRRRKNRKLICFKITTTKRTTMMTSPMMMPAEIIKSYASRSPELQIAKRKIERKKKERKKERTKEKE